MPGISKVVLSTVKMVSDKLDGAKSQAMELFGYDIMVDTEYQSWLLEVNSSPTMEYSTQITKDLA